MSKHVAIPWDLEYVAHLAVIWQPYWKMATIKKSYETSHVPSLVSNIMEKKLTRYLNNYSIYTTVC